MNYTYYIETLNKINKDIDTINDIEVNSFRESVVYLQSISGELLDHFSDGIKNTKSHM